MRKNRISEPGPVPIRVESPKCGEPLVVAFLGPLEGLDTHYYRGQSEACLGDAECNPAFHRTRIIWKGYAPVQRWDEPTQLWHAAVLEVTEGAEYLLRGRKLRGELWIFSRMGKKKNGPVTGLFEYALPEEQLQPVFDLLLVMQRFYHSNLLQLNAQNSLPPKAYQVPTAGERPRCMAEAAPPVVSEEDKKRQREEVQKVLREAMEKNGYRRAKT